MMLIVEAEEREKKKKKMKRERKRLWNFVKLVRLGRVILGL